MWLFHYLILKGIMSKNPCILLNKNISLNKNKTKFEMGNPTHSFRDRKHEAQIKSKTDCDELELSKEKRGHFLYRLCCPKEIF